MEIKETQKRLVQYTFNKTKEENQDAEKVIESIDSDLLSKVVGK